MTERASLQSKILCLLGLALMLTPCYVTSIPLSSPISPDTDKSVAEPKNRVIVSQNGSYQNRNRITQPAVGSNRTFWTLNHSSLTYYQIDAQLLAIGIHCYIYMEDVAVDFLGESVCLERGETYQDKFDNVIYPAVVELAGNPDGTHGDIDGDPRMIILLSTNPTSYYGHVNDHDVSPYSNLCEMVYVRYTSSYILGVISHEFHHLILFNHDDNETPFVFESLAQFAAKYTGSIIPWDNITWGVSEFLLHPEESLVYWTPNIGGAEAEIDYGSAYLFGLYLAEQFGIQFMRDLVVEEQDGAEGIVATLEGMGNNISFNELYLDWITALAIDQPSIANGQYGFQDANATIRSVEIVSEIPHEDDDLSLRCYAFDIRRLVTPPDYFVVGVTSLPSHTFGLSIAYHDEDGWHVQQKIQRGGMLVEIVDGSSIDNAYIMTTYLYEDTPSGAIFYGFGESITAHLVILEEIPDTLPANLIPVVAGIGILSVVVIVIVWQVKKRKP